MGQLLAGSALLDALKTTDRVFREGSWIPGQLRGSGYDLRLAGDLLVIPSTPGSSSYKAVDKGTPEVTEFILAPGDSALISTIERFSFDFNVSAIIGPKFRWAAKGLLVLQGTAAHPGYGRIQDAGGHWVPKEDERLYFVVANVGPIDIPMRKGDPIAYLHIFDIESSEAPASVTNVGYEFLRDRLFRANEDVSDGGLAYFRTVKDLQRNFEARDQELTKEWNEFRQKAATDYQDLTRQVTNAQTSVDRVNNAANVVVVFGVFLVSTTVLGFVLAVLVDLIEKLPPHLGTARTVWVATLCTVYGAATLTGVALVFIAVRTAIGKRKITSS